jgi:ABC-type nitrate/sulfonate/bicarbonate transport system substrate-binding protein
MKPSYQKKISKVQKGMQNAQKWCDSNSKQVTKIYGKKG